MTKHQHYGTCDLNTGYAGSVLGLSYPDERAYKRDGVCSGVMTIQVGTIMLDIPNQILQFCDTSYVHALV